MYFALGHSTSQTYILYMCFENCLWKFFINILENGRLLTKVDSVMSLQKDVWKTIIFSNRCFPVLNCFEIFIKTWIEQNIFTLANFSVRGDICDM